uniref:Membrane-bound transcription factor site-2 protease n=1 Tax=Globodera pallida TaxID=36090 RepID=A0A183CJ49_GLOPA
MSFFTLLSVVLFSWIFVLFSDFYLRYFNSQRYINFLEKHRISVTPFQVRVYLSNFESHPRLTFALLKSVDRCILGLRRRSSRFLAFWFTVGAVVSLCCFVLTPVYLFRLLLDEFGAVIHGPSPVRHVPTHFNPQSHAEPTAPIAVPSHHSLLQLPVREHFHSGIMPIFPGLNIPFSHIPIFVTVLILSSIVHEAGHAVAAANSNVRVTGLGVFLFAIYPGAFTEVEPDQLERCSCAQRLRIFGAGIWHNIVLALLGVLILLLIPVLSLPFYSNSAGIVVVDVDPKSGLYGPTGLRAGHHIQRINQCEVRNASDWAACFGQIWETSRPHPAYQKGFLAQFKAVAQMTASNGHIIQDHSDGEVQCCNEFNVSNATHICFRYLAPLSADVQPSEGPSAEKQTTTPKPIFPKFPDFDAEFGVKSDGSALQHAQAVHLRRKRANLKMHFFAQTKVPNSAGHQKSGSNAIGEVNLPPADFGINAQSPRKYSHACLPAMQITEHALCDSPSSSSPSFGILDASLTATLPSGYVCVVPALYNDTALLRFLVTGQARPVLFIGYLNEPLHMVEVAELTPRFGLIPWWMPRVAELFARYLITLSLAMGILNAVPCYGLDGQFIGATVVDYFCQNWPLSVRKRMSNMLVTSGTVIFCSNILIGFARSLFNNH